MLKSFPLFVRNSKFLRLCGTLSDTYELRKKLKEEVVDDNITLSSKCYLEVQNGFKSLPIMYCLAKMHKTPTKAMLIVAT